MVSLLVACEHFQTNAHRPPSIPIREEFPPKKMLLRNLEREKARLLLLLMMEGRNG